MNINNMDQHFLIIEVGCIIGNSIYYSSIKTFVKGNRYFYNAGLFVIYYFFILYTYL